MAEDISPVFEFETDINDAAPPPPLPEAEYPATVQAVEMTKNKKGQPMAVISLLISASAYPPDFADGDPDGTVLRDYRTVHTERRLLYLNKQTMNAYGVRIKRRGDGTSSIDMNDLQGQDVLVTVKHGEYQGRTTVGVGSVRPR
jgi:hypothetical protein